MEAKKSAADLPKNSKIETTSPSTYLHVQATHESLHKGASALETPCNVPEDVTPRQGGQDVAPRQGGHDVAPGGGYAMVTVWCM